MSISKHKTAGVQVGLLTLSFLLFALVGPQEAQAQRWLQTAKVVTPIEQDGSVRAFLDTLVQVASHDDSIQVKRFPSQKPAMTATELENQLIEEHGIALTSANNAIIDYRFEIDNERGFQQSIDKIQFLFRPSSTEEDIRILYVDVGEGWVENVLNQKGTSLTSNQASHIPFQKQLGFARIAQLSDSKIVEIGNQTVREGFEREKEVLIRKVRRIVYDS